MPAQRTIPTESNKDTKQRAQLEAIARLWSEYGCDAAHYSLNATGQCGFVCDADGKVTFANSKFKNLALEEPCRPLEWFEQGSPSFDLNSDQVEGNVSIPLPNQSKAGHMSLRRVGEKAIGLISFKDDAETAGSALDARSSISSPAEESFPARDTSGPLGERCPLRILMAEDNAVNQKVACMILRNLNYKVDVVDNGLEAVKAVSQKEYDVVLMDIQMPEMDGYDATRTIHTLLPQDKQPYVIAVTANPIEENKQRALDAGMRDYVRKPISPVLISAALQQAYAFKHAFAGS